MRRTIEEIVELVFSLVLLALLVATGVLALIQSRPVSINFVIPYVWPFIQPYLHDVNLNYKNISLEWPADAAALQLNAEGLELNYRRDVAAAASGKFSLYLDPIRSVRQHEAVLTNVSLDDVHARVAIQPPDQDAGQGQGQDPELQLKKGVEQAGRVLASVFARPVPGLQLEKAHLGGLELVLTEAGRSLAIGPAAVDWMAAGSSAQLKADSMIGGGHISGRLAPLPESGKNDVGIEIDLEKIVPGPLVGFWGVEQGAQLDAPIDGHAAAVVAEDGSLSPILFNARTAATQLALPGIFEDAVSVDELSARGSVDLNDLHLKLDEASLATGRGRIDAALDAFLAAKGRHLTLSLKGQQVDSKMITDYWPTPILPQVRDWLKANLQDGTASHASLDVAWTQQPPEMPDDVKLGVAFDASGTKVSFLDGFPAVEEAVGTGRIDEHGMQIDLRSAKLQGLAIGPSRLEMAFMPAGQPDTLRLQASGEGDVPAALSLVEQLPMLKGSQLPIRPAQTKGRASFKLNLGLPIADDIEMKDVTLGVDVQARELAIRELAPGLDLSQAQASVMVDKEHVEASGKGVIDGVPATIDKVWVSIVPDDRRPVEATVTLAIDQHVLDLYRISPSLLSMSGVLPSTVNVRVPRVGEPVIQVDADLGPAQLKVPALAILKRKGVPGRATFGLRRNSLETRVDGLSLLTPDLEFDGDIVLTMDERLKSLTIRNAVQGLTRLSGTLENDVARGYVGTINARTFDLRPFMAAGESSDKASKTGSTTRSVSEALSAIPPLDLSIAANELILPGGNAHTLKLRLTRRPGAWQLIDLSAMMPSGSTISAQLTGKAGGSPFEFETDDAGAVLTALERGARFATGGRLRVKGTLTGESPLRLNGQIELHDFVAEQAPVLAKVLTLASFTGILNTLQGNGISFDRGRAHFDYDDDQIRISDGLVHGSELGLTFRGDVDLDKGKVAMTGTVIPAFTINRAIGQIPLLGTLMRGAHGVGAFAVTFWADGPIDDPAVGVNPLSLIVPGALRDWMSEMSRPSR
ncbi:YhdP family protein [Arboricoccus pini]|nr:AsmA-like C-terminal domain-containing protein [Arboricoccus pini]